jgi:hypothetical protein
MLPVILVANQVGASLFNRSDVMAMRRLTLVLLSALAAIAVISSLV